MADRMFASEGSSVNVEPAVRGDRWDDFLPRAPDEDEAPAGVARRLHGRLDRHLWLLARMQADALQPEPAGFAELLDTARRLRRDAESLLLLYGLDPGRRTDEPRRLSDVLGDAAAAADEPRRVDVRPVPAATLPPVAATELLHVLAELVDHVSGAYPGARVEVTSRVEPPGAIVIDVSAHGAIRYDPTEPAGRRALAAAARLAQRSRNGIAVRTPPSDTGVGPVASVHCPSSVVTIKGLERPVSHDYSIPVGTVDLPRREPPPPPPGADLPAVGSLPREPSLSIVNGEPLSLELSLPHIATDIPLEPTLSPPEVPTHAPVRSSSPIDELFGPLVDIPHSDTDEMVATPIFEAIASAWFREDRSSNGNGNGHGTNGHAVDWETPVDSEWRAAAARAAAPDETQLTASGLPRRRPGNKLVPPRVRTTTPDWAPAERMPDRVRDRLSGYQRGLRQGRHRAESHDTDPRDSVW